MPDPQTARCYRFGTFEADAATGELRKQGIRVRLNAQPFQVLLLLLERQGELVSREEIARELWPDGTFVDYEHGVNSAVNRLREALGDTASNPRFIETLARRGYRFVAPVERYRDQATPPGKNHPSGAPAGSEGIREQEKAGAREQEPPIDAATNIETGILARVLATPEDLPKAPHALVQTLFVLFQLMYIGFYVGALANLGEISELFAPLRRPELALNILIASAAILIPVRAFLLCAVLLHAPRIKKKFLRIWPLLLLFDVLWALSPFLLLHHIDVGLAIACMALLVYSPFAQRSLMLMGAGQTGRSA